MKPLNNKGTKNQEIMKTKTVYPNFSKSLVGKSPAITEIYEFNQEPNFKNFTLPVPMTDQEVAPPLHVWDKIARILDEQESKKQFLNQSTPRGFQSQTITQKPVKYNKFGVAFLGALTVVGLMWILASLFR